MDPAPILSFSTPQTSRRVEVSPSPALELAYALYFLAQHPASERQREDLPWVDRLYREAPDLPGAIRDFWPEPAKYAALELFFLVCVGGYAKDDGLERFFAEAGRLPERLRGLADPEANEVEKGEHGGRAAEVIRGRLEALAEPRRMEAYLALLGKLWAQIRAHWEGEGRLAAHRAQAALLERLAETDDILAALPPHHYLQFEASAEELRAAQAGGALLVVPLSVAAGGGFNFDMEGRHYLGFGLRSEQTFERLRGRAESAAARMKALADPTRLTLLTLVSRYQGVAMTVGDLARQLGVSQPTASGHLKLLREAGLVTPQKKGTRTFYRFEDDEAARLLDELTGLLSIDR